VGGLGLKELGVSVFGVIALALALGLLFRWLYPQVELTAELTALFAFVAVLLRLLVAKAWGLRRKPGAGTGTEPKP
jgi:hypothetical protein